MKKRLRTIDSVFEDFESIRYAEGTTKAIEYLALENQHLLSQEDPDKENSNKYIYGTLTKAIGIIEDLELKTRYDFKILDFLKTIKAYNLEHKKEKNSRDFKEHINRFQSASNIFKIENSEESSILVGMALNYLGLTIENSKDKELGIYHMNSGLKYADKIAYRKDSKYQYLAKVLANANIRWNIAVAKESLEDMKIAVKARENAMLYNPCTINENYMIGEYATSLRKTIGLMEKLGKIDEPDYTSFRKELEGLSILEFNHGFLSIK